jgi:hypothetical protein
MAHLPRTAFKPGQSGNPADRRPGSRRRVTIEAQTAATQIIDDPVYVARLRQRLLDGTAGAMEPLIWDYAYGKPVQRVEASEPGAFTTLTDDELKVKLRDALTTLK